MPTIKLLKDTNNKPTIDRQPKKSYNYKKTGKSEIIQHLYSSQKWVKLRRAYYMEHPLCEHCLTQGIENEDGGDDSIIRPAQDIHHIKFISTGNDVLEMMQIAYDYNNLVALCRWHHYKIHGLIKKK